MVRVSVALSSLFLLFSSLSLFIREFLFVLIVAQPRLNEKRSKRAGKEVNGCPLSI